MRHRVVRRSACSSSSEVRMYHGHALYMNMHKSRCRTSFSVIN